MLFRARQFVFEFPRPALVMGILNVTPDSFSDGGRFLDVKQAVARAHELVDQGAEILDVGGESTRPGAPQVSEAEELHRVLPVIEALSRQVRVPISIDTVKPAVARAALMAGASLVNDVAANREQDLMWRIVADSGAGYVCMHMLGTPPTMQSNPHYDNVVTAVGAFFEDRLDRLRSRGVKLEHVALDPGIGFGKTTDHNLQLLGAVRDFKKFERPLVLGISRKSFIGTIVPTDVSQRLPGSLACATLAVASGVHIIRAHDVVETVQAVRVTEAVQKARNQE